MKKKKGLLLIMIMLAPLLLLLISNQIVEQNAKDKTFVDVSEIQKNKVG
tara:strand:+ start:992 stop:1138 length:147 start_codon:yes stop_codon:yes gene_type:complete